jgi:hypothetical protein
MIDRKSLPDSGFPYLAGVDHNGVFRFLSKDGETDIPAGELKKNGAAWWVQLFNYYKPEVLILLASEDYCFSFPLARYWSYDYQNDPVVPFPIQDILPGNNIDQNTENIIRKKLKKYSRLKKSWEGSAARIFDINDVPGGILKKNREKILSAVKAAARSCGTVIDSPTDRQARLNIPADADLFLGVYHHDHAGRFWAGDDEVPMEELLTWTDGLEKTGGINLIATCNFDPVGFPAPNPRSGLVLRNFGYQSSIDALRLVSRYLLCIKNINADSKRRVIDAIQHCDNLLIEYWKNN